MTARLSESLALAQRHLEQNRLDEAIGVLSELLVQDPLNLDVKLFLGVLYARSDQLSRARLLLEQVVSIDPTHRTATLWLAIVEKGLGNLQFAARMFQRVIDWGHATAENFNQLGLCCMGLRDPVAAGAAFRRAIESNRSSAEGYFNLGMALSMSGISYETFATFKRAIELDPDNLQAYVQLWSSMRQLLNWAEGLPLLELGMKRHPNSTQMKVMLAATLGKLGKNHLAESIFRSIASIDPSAGPPYAHWLQEEGRFEESVQVLQSVVRLDPIQGQAYYNLAVGGSFELDGKAFADLIPNILDRTDLSMEDRMFLHYALAKAFDKQRRFEQAMAQYDFANDHAYRLFNSQEEYDPVAVEAEHEVLKSLYSQDTLAKLRAFGSNSYTPIFIVGMIRTGTTLLDQILSSHSDVRSAGEQPFWQVNSGRINRRWKDSGANPADLAELERRYLTVLRDATGGARRVTDKMPTNFVHIGLMSAVFPEAKFIHIRRNPLDTCVSIYTTFLGSGTQFAYNQTNIVRYYQSYLRTMDLWRTVISPEQMIEIDYEELVSDKENLLRVLTDFLQLEWDDALLSHERQASHVTTPSLWAVRQPVNSASVQRWRRYEPWLGELLKLSEVSHPPHA